MAYQPMSGHRLRFRLSRKCSKLFISADLSNRSRARPAPQIRFTRVLSLRPRCVFQFVIINIIIFLIYSIVTVINSPPARVKNDKLLFQAQDEQGPSKRADHPVDHRKSPSVRAGDTDDEVRTPELYLL